TDSPIPKELLLSEAILLIREEGSRQEKPLEGSEYLFSLNTDFEGWIKDFETATASKYIKCQKNQSVNGTCTYYRCHCGETYESVAGNNLSDKKSRKIQKQSIKCGCKLQLIVTKTSSPGMQQMIIKYIPHSGHISGSTKDIKTLRISQEVWEWIANSIRAG
ncbi:609_t:CDS:1, partial [Racocetra fulgida]